MIDPNKKERGEVKASDVCYRAFELMKEQQFEDAEKLLLNNMNRTEDDASIALFHSALGVLYKMKGEFKTAWKHYERAEKLLPNDPALKIISARLLIEQFAEYDQAIKKAKKVLSLVSKHPPFVHQAYTTLGLAFVKKGDKRHAIDALKKSMGENFHGFVSAKNIDFQLVETLLRRKWGIDDIRVFLRAAVSFAEHTEEVPFMTLFRQMLTAFAKEYPSTDEDTQS